MPGPRTATPFRVALCGHQAVEVAGVCLLLMVQGSVLDATAAHALIATKTGLIAVAPAFVLTFTRHAAHLANRWTSAFLVGVSAAVADAAVHGSHYPGALTEAALTGIGSALASIALSYTPVGKRLDALAHVFLEAPAPPAAEPEPQR